MSESIQLKVPAQVTQDVVVIDPKTRKPDIEKQPVEFVSQGDFSAELKPNSLIETKSRQFADFLINEYNLTEINAETASGGDGSANEPNPLEAEYPANFPKRKIFIALGIPFETARGLDRDQLIAINGIAGPTADQILAWQPAPPTPPNENSDTNAQQNSNDNGGQE